MDKAAIEAKLTDDVTEGIKAESLVNNPVWKEVVSEYEEALITSIRKSSFLQFNNGGINLGKKAREENTRRLQVLDDLVVLINNRIEKGEESFKRLEASKNGSKQRRI